MWLFTSASALRVFVCVCPSGAISDNTLIIPFTSFSSLSLPSPSIPLSPQPFFPLCWSHHLLMPHFLSSSSLLIPAPYQRLLPSVSLPGGRPCGRGGLCGAGHPEQPVPVERGVLGGHLLTRHDTVRGHQERRGNGPGQRGIRHGGRPQGEVPAENCEWRVRVRVRVRVWVRVWVWDPSWILGCCPDFSCCTFPCSNQWHCLPSLLWLASWSGLLWLVSGSRQQSPFTWFDRGCAGLAARCASCW